MIDIDVIDEITCVRNLVKNNISYDILLHDGENKSYIETIVETMTDIIALNKNKIKISGIEYPSEVVKSVLMKLNIEHIRYVLMCLENNTTHIKKIDSYILTCLYNSYKTMGSYYNLRTNSECRCKKKQKKEKLLYENDE